MTQTEALRLALEALEDLGMKHHENTGEVLYKETFTAIKAALEAKDEPVGKLQKPTGERAWFTISELNAWADKKLSENPHWVMPKDEPERDDPPPQRTWVGLTDQEIGQVFKEKCTEYRHWLDERAFRIACRWAEEKLKEKNT